MTAEAAEALAVRLAGDMIQAWRRGERPLPEAFLAQHPELWEHPEAAADLIYEELCLRQEYGPEVPVEQVLGRFPQWRPQLEVLFDCQRVLGPHREAPQFPAAGDALGDFVLLAELGRGGQGRVFLASQLSLGGRPVVLKLAPCEASEHLSLARLQHTHIVPLYCVQDHAARGLRALCMPYFGGATLAQLLETLRGQPPAQRTGQTVLEALDRVQAAAPLVVPARGPARQGLATASYVHAMCWVGACLADALQYAHDRGLVHLDLKPSNVLLAADGQPMLLDFHLAHEPVHGGGAGPPWLGGTTGYMSPEQEAALQAIQQGRTVERSVDGRSDIYSLGVVLYEALAGSLPETEGKPLSLNHANGHVSVGLADVVGKCLAGNPDERYPHMAALAADLRRHLAHLPLAGVRNRSLGERWQKWRQRRPHGIALAGMMLAVLTAAAAVALGAVSHFSQRIDEARTALNEGQTEMTAGQWDGAIRTFQRGLGAAQGIPLQEELTDELERRLHQAEQAQRAAARAAAALELHQLTDRVRFLYGANYFPPEGLHGLESCCRTFWENRGRIVERLSTDFKKGSDPLNAKESDLFLKPEGGTILEPVVRDDLLDLAIFWADLQVRLAPPAAKAEANHAALSVLAQAEALFGPSRVLEEERKRYLPPGAPAGGVQTAEAPAASSRREATAWEHYAMGRSLLRSGAVERAAEEVQRAVHLQPQGMWPNFYQGLCAYRGAHYADAVTAYSVCIGAAPEAAGCFFNRGLAYAALERPEMALRDYDQAVRLDPTLTVAVLNRGMLHYRAKRLSASTADFKRAQELGADPAAIAFSLALVDLARAEHAAALEHLRQALRHNPHHAEARNLHDVLVDRASRLDSPPFPTASATGTARPAPAPVPHSR